MSVLEEKRENSLSCFNKIFENADSQLTNLEISGGIATIK